MLPKLSQLHGDSRVLFFMATNHLRSFDDAITRPGRFDLLIHVRPPSWADKLTKLEIAWPGTKRRDLETIWPSGQRIADQRFVKERFLSWVPITSPTAEILNRFTPGELESFLETIGEGPDLRVQIQAMAKEDFINKVDLWGKRYIALHSDVPPAVSGELTLLQEFQLDKSASRI